MKLTPIKGYEGKYSIGEDSKVYSYISNKYLKQGMAGNGYYTVSLKNKSYTVHRLMLNTFKPNLSGKRLICNHIDGDKTNNKIHNLEWCSYADNIKHAYETGLRKYSNHRQKIFEPELLKMEKMLNEGHTKKEISKCFNITHIYTCRILKGRGL